MPDASHEALTLPPLAYARGEVALPGSKSISNRTLLLATLARGTTRVRGLLAAEDVECMRAALGVLGVGLASGEDPHELDVTGTGGRFPAPAAKLFLGNAGTAFRPLTAALAIHGGDYELSGVARMQERPIGDLVDALRGLGCEIRYLGNAGFPPLAIGASNARAGATVRIRGDVSSQFLSALLMALPLVRGSANTATRVGVTTPLISRPYVAITTNLMRRFGVTVAAPDPATFVVPANSGYESPGEYRVEGDASAASYFLAAGVLGGGPVRVTGVGRDSIQGDVAFAGVLARLGARIDYGPDWIEARTAGALAGGTIDCTDIPDAAMTLAVVALFAREAMTLTGIASWRVKESDRITAMAAELTKLGATVAVGNDRLTVVPPSPLSRATIDTYDDHRIAMCFALAAFGGVPVTIRDPDCVRKTFPEYFNVLARITGAQTIWRRAGEG